MTPIIRIQDIADILILSFLIYQLYSWFRKTRAMQVVLGLGIVILIYFVTRFLGLYMTSWLLQQLGTVLVVLIIVVFQVEIRQALYRFSLLRDMFGTPQEGQAVQFQEIAETLFDMAARRNGAILVFQRGESLSDHMHNGVKLDCEITPQILVAIFSDGAPLHDGAVLVRNGRIAFASCHLPLSINPDIPQHLGTRHRAAIGLSEKTDAAIIVVSEERGELSLAVSGELRRIATPMELIAALEGLLTPISEKPLLTYRERFFSNLLPKIAVLLVVMSFWVLVTSRQGQITSVNAPVRLHGLPEGLVIVKSSPEDVEVQLKSLSSLTPAPGRLDIAADIDVSGVREGQTTVMVRNGDFKLPSGMVVSSVAPQSIRIAAERKIRRTVPVKATLRGVLPRALKGYDLVAEPATAQIEGPVTQVSKIDSLPTEEIDASRLEKGKEYRVTLLPMPKLTSVIDEGNITVRVAVHKKTKR